jgi:hypothetical protein
MAWHGMALGMWLHKIVVLHVIANLLQEMQHSNTTLTTELDELTWDSSELG